jgi:hemin uptake protein HemP
MSPSLAHTDSTTFQNPREPVRERKPRPANSGLRSEDLLCGEREVLIVHAGVEYRLRHTRLGKLILTK